MIFVTGGAGFIGANFVLEWLAHQYESVLNLDKLTYAGNRENLQSLEMDSRHVFVHGDIGDVQLVQSLLTRYKPRAIVNFAAESHVDRSIRGAEDFIQTNIVGLFRLLEVARVYWRNLEGNAKIRFRFLQVSTDEVYGSLESTAAAFRETDRYEPNSPYSASKAAGDHLVRACYRTYGLPVLTTNCANNYGPCQFPEKLIPLMITRALAGETLPLYGSGLQVRDWLYVKDHCKAISLVLEAGRPGEIYNVGCSGEKSNIEVVSALCDLLDELCPRVVSAAGAGEPGPLTSYTGQITYVADRAGHDARYAIDSSKIKAELGWRAVETFEGGLRKTVRWYLDNPAWIEGVQQRMRIS